MLLLVEIGGLGIGCNGFDGNEEAKELGLFARILVVALVRDMVGEIG